MKKQKKNRKPVRKKRIKNRKRELVQTVRENSLLSNTPDGTDAEVPIEMPMQGMTLNAFQSCFNLKLLDDREIGPRLEVYTDSDLIVESLNRLLGEAKKQADLVNSRTTKETVENFSTIFDDYPEAKITYKSLTRILLMNDESKGWLAAIAYKGILKPEYFLLLAAESDRKNTSMEMAEETVINALADLMLKDGIENPECIL